MKALTIDNLLKPYQDNSLCYKIFHSYHPIASDEPLTYQKRSSTPLKALSQMQQTTVQPSQSTQIPQQTSQTTQVTSIVQDSAEPQVTQSTSHSQPDVVATDRTPQNSITFPRTQQASQAITSNPAPIHETVGPNLNQQPQQTSQTTQATSITQQVTPQPVQQTVPIQIHREQRHGERFEPHVSEPVQATTPIGSIPNVVSQQTSPAQPISQHSKVTKNILDTAINKTNQENTKKDIQAEIHDQITKTANQLNWIKKVNSFDIAYKKDLQNLPIPALRVFDVNDAEEMILPLDDGAILHDVYSITITKDLCLMLLFRNNAAIKLAPENWYQNGKNKDILLKNGFEYFYKTYGLEVNKLVKTLQILSVTSTSTKEFTQFILKTMLFKSVR